MVIARARVPSIVLCGSQQRRGMISTGGGKGQRTASVQVMGLDTYHLNLHDE